MPAANADVFGPAGVYVPSVSPITPDLAGNHNVAWELAGDPQLAPANVARPVACISSEKFEFLERRPEGLRRLVDGLAAIG